MRRAKPMAGDLPHPPPPPEKADLTAWLAVAAGTLGALMATLDISIVNSALPTIQGEIGASGTEGTWSQPAIWWPKSSSFRWPHGSSGCWGCAPSC
jgi:hypothetical protein